MKLAPIRRLARARTGVALLFTFSAAAVGAGLGRSLVTTYLPVLLERIRDAPGLIGTVMLVNTASGLLVPLIVGAWSDRLRDRGHGRTRPFVLGGSVFAAGGLLAVALGHASSYLLLALFAGITYTGLNAITTGHRALIAEDFDDEERGAATGSEEVALVIGTLSGLLVGGALIELAGWAPFVVGAVLLPLLALPTVRRMRGRERERATAEHERPGLRYYARAAVRPGGRLLLLAQGLWVLGYVGLPPFFVLYAKHELALRPSVAALLLAAFGLCCGVAMLCAGTVPPPRHRTLLVAGAGAMGGGLLAVAAAPSVAFVAAALLPVAVGFGVLTTLGFPAYATFIPAGEEGAYSALYFSVRSIASAVALPAAGWTIALTGSYRSLFVFGGCAALMALLPLVTLRGRRAGWRASAARALPSLGLLVVATGLLLAGGLVVERTALLEADVELFSLLNGIGSSPELIDGLLVDPHIPNYVALTLITGLAAHSWHRQGLRSAATVAAAALLAYALTRLCWAVWERPRPEEVLGIAPANGHSWDGFPSFPSGHVVVTTAIVTSASALVPQLRLPLWIYAVLIAVTRVSYGAHFPTDVLAGVALGYLSGRATVALADPNTGGLREALGPLLSLSPARMRRAARISGALALAAFAVLAATEGAPASPDGGVLGEPLERNLQLGLIGMAGAALAAGWYRDALGALLVPTGVALGVFAALEYSPLFAVLACLAFALPGTLFVLACERLRTPRRLVGVGVLLAAVLAVGAVAALEVHGLAYGPAHPESSLPAPPTWRVQWAWSGGVTPDAATVNARLNADGRVRLVVSPRRDLRARRATPMQVTRDGLGERIVSFRLEGLRPDTRYFYAIEFDGRVDRDRVGTFRTFPRGRDSFRLAFSACARVGSNGAVFDAIRRERPLLFLLLGDFFYANIDEEAPGRFLDQYDRALTTPAQSRLYRSAPVDYVWDDHDYGGDGADASSDSRAAARWAFGRAVPHPPLPAGARGSIERAFTVGRVRFIVMDTRSARQSSAPRTLLGGRQLDWVKAELLAARDRYELTVLVSSVPWIESASAAADGWGAFPAERRHLARFIARHRIRRLLMVGGDAHMLAIDDGANSDYSGTGRAGFPVMHAGALDRPGHAKGGPYSEGAHPGAGQYGVLTVQDRPRGFRVELSGRDYGGREIVHYSFSPSRGRR